MHAYIIDGQEGVVEEAEGEVEKERRRGIVR